MHVTAIDPVLVSHVYPDDEVLEWSAGRIESWDAALIRIELNTGHVGWGEAGHAITGTEAVPGIVDVFREQIVERDPVEAPAIAQELYDRNLFWARGGLPTGVIGAVEIALYDALGRATGRPVFQILGGQANPEVATYGSGGIGPSITSRVDQAVEYANRGFETVKIRALSDPSRTETLVDQTLTALPDSVSLALDAVQGSSGDPWSVTDALRLGQALESDADRIAWYEEPCRAENLDGYRRVRNHLTVPVTGIETYTGLAEWRQVLAADAVDMLQPDVTIAGGFTTTSQISGLAATQNLSLALHVWGTAVSMMANLHFAVADSNTEVVEYCQLPNPLRDEFLPCSLDRNGSDVVLGDDPGLGVNIPENIDDEYAYSPGKGHVFD